MDSPKFITLSHVAKDITGHRFGQLVALGPIGKIDGEIQWLCRCDCGTQVVYRGGDLRAGDKDNCGHLRAQRRIAALVTHGQSKGKEYRAWVSMKQRCYNPNNTQFHDYGGRGITVCDQWRNDFECFLADVGKSPPNSSLDRIDNDGNYTPDNCQWSSRTIQQRNRRACHYLTFKGEAFTVTEWAERIGVNTTTLQNRIQRGWSTERALTTPVKSDATFEFDGQSKTLTEWSLITGIERPTLYYRLVVYGWSAERALTTPTQRQT